MKILLDNNVPDPLRIHLSGRHEVSLARELGWATLSNGALLKAAEEAGFALMITGDKNLSYQQNLKERRIALIVLGTIHWATLEANLSSLVSALARVAGNSFEQLPKLPRIVRRRDPTA